MEDTHDNDLNLYPSCCLFYWHRRHAVERMMTPTMESRLKIIWEVDPTSVALGLEESTFQQLLNRAGQIEIQPVFVYSKGYTPNGELIRVKREIENSSKRLFSCLRLPGSARVNHCAILFLDDYPGKSTSDIIGEFSETENGDVVVSASTESVIQKVVTT